MNLGMPTLLEIDRIEDQAALCNELGLSFVEINLNIPSYSYEHLTPEYLDRIKEQYGIGFTLHLPEELDVASFHEPIRLATVAYIETIMKWAKACKIEIITMHLNSGVYFTLPLGRQYINVKYYAEYLKSLVSSMSRLYQLADSLDLELCIENTNNFDIDHIKEALEVLSAYKGFSLTWDVGHVATSDFRESQTIDQYKKHVRHMHLHDYDGRRNHLALNSGHLDIEYFLSFAQENQIKVVVEVKDKQSLRQSLINLKELGLLK